MATINKDGHIIGPLGNLRFYSSNGINIVATKGGPSAKQIKTAESYAFTRAHNAEFGLVSKVTSAIYRYHQEMKPIMHPNAHQFLRSYLFRMYSYDDISRHGQRSLLFSKAHHHFDHLQVSDSRYTDYVSLPLTWAQSGEDNTTFKIHDFAAKNAFQFPKFYDHVDWSLHVQGIKDIHFNPSKNDYDIMPFEDILPLESIASFQFYKHQRYTELQCSAVLNRDYNYLVFAVASFCPTLQSKAAVFHVMACMGVIAGRGA